MSVAPVSLVENVYATGVAPVARDAGWRVLVAAASIIGLLALAVAAALLPGDGGHAGVGSAGPSSSFAPATAAAQRLIIEEPVAGRVVETTELPLRISAPPEVSVVDVRAMQAGLLVGETTLPAEAGLAQGIVRLVLPDVAAPVEIVASTPDGALHAQLSIVARSGAVVALWRATVRPLAHGALVEVAGMIDGRARLSRLVVTDSRGQPVAIGRAELGSPTDDALRPAAAALGQRWFEASLPLPASAVDGASLELDWQNALDGTAGMDFASLTSDAAGATARRAPLHGSARAVASL
ncbi:MAG TPA: hypothetical protein VF763_06455 [Candidatus Limnocylindrales bacterium]